MLALEKGTARGEHKPATVFRTGDNDFVCINFYISHLVSSDRVVMRPSLKVHGYRDAFPCIITALTVVVSDAFLWDGSCRTSVYRQWVFAMPHLALPFIGAHWWEHNSNSNFFFFACCCDSAGRFSATRSILQTPAVSNNKLDGNIWWIINIKFL